jgi:photosystem II stability/assembly factor-like uncharacterized protein
MPTSVRFLYTAILFLITSQLIGASNNSTVYASTLSTVTIGSKGTASALFHRQLNSTGVWQFYERPNNLVFGFDIFTPKKGNLIAMATQNGVLQSSDHGKTWKRTTGWRMTEVQCVTFDTTNSDILYAGTPYGFYKTINNGKSWKQYNTGLKTPDATYVSAIVVDYSKPTRIFISTEDGVYKSENSGDSWVRLNGLSVKHIRTIVQHPSQPNTLVVGTENNGIYFSKNNGISWTKCNSEIQQNTFYAITYDKNNPNIIYAGGFKTGILKSTDAGITWKEYHKGLDCLDIQSIAVAPGDSSIVFAGTLGKGIYKSTDSGQTWKSVGLDGSLISKILVENF